jgi:hypothetical protein
MPRQRAGKRQKSGTNNAAFAAAKVISDADVASGGTNPSPVGRPPTLEAAAALSPPTAPRQGSEKRAFEAPISHVLTEPVRPKIAVCPNFGSRASLML